MAVRIRSDGEYPRVDFDTEATDRPALSERSKLIPGISGPKLGDLIMTVNNAVFLYCWSSPEFG